MNDSIIFYTDEILNIETYWDLKNKSAIIPYLTSNEIISISNPFEGLIVFDRILQEFFIYKNSVWIELLNIGGGNITYQDIIDALGYTPENVENKVTTIIPELINNTEYPTTSAVFNYIAEIISTKFDIPTGTASDYLDGTGTPTPFPTMLSADKMITIGRNSTGETLHKGTIIYLSGSTGNRPNFVKAQANAEGTSARTFGVILDDIPDNTDGNCVTIGTIDNLDTRSTAPNPFTTDTLLDGDTIYLSPTNAGYVTRVKPSAPNHLVYIGKVVRTSPTNGTIVYQIQNGFELDEIHDVQIQTLQNNDLLLWDSDTSLWKNKQLTSGIVTTALGYTPQSTDTNLYNTSGSLTSNRIITLNSLNLTITGTTSSVFFANGNVAIGTTTNAGFKLDVNGTTNITAQGALSTDIAFRVRNSANTGNILQVSGNGNVQVGVGGLSICRADTPNGSLIATITYGTDQTFRFSHGLTASRYTDITSSSSYIESKFYNGTWQVYGSGSGTNSVFLIKTVATSTNSYFLKLQNASTDLLNLTISGNLLLGTSTDAPSAILNLTSTTKGFLPPRMTSAQRTAISTPAIGLIVYQTDGTEGVYVNTSTGWKQLLM